MLDREVEALCPNTTRPRGEQPRIPFSFNRETRPCMSRAYQLPSPPLQLQTPATRPPHGAGLKAKSHWPRAANSLRGPDPPVDSMRPSMRSSSLCPQARSVVSICCVSRLRHSREWGLPTLSSWTTGETMNRRGRSARGSPAVGDCAPRRAGMDNSSSPGPAARARLVALTD